MAQTETKIQIKWDIIIYIGIVISCMIFLMVMAYKNFYPSSFEELINTRIYYDFGKFFLGVVSLIEMFICLKHIIKSKDFSIFRWGVMIVSAGILLYLTISPVIYMANMGKTHTIPRSQNPVSGIDSKYLYYSDGHTSCRIIAPTIKFKVNESFAQIHNWEREYDYDVYYLGFDNGTKGSNADRWIKLKPLTKNIHLCNALTKNGICDNSTMTKTLDVPDCVLCATVTADYQFIDGNTSCLTPQEKSYYDYTQMEYDGKA
ncbi:MAG: hypothetical protein WC770_04480 [Phycisphaerae bacterium]|jgi:hypothetical protein